MDDKHLREVEQLFQAVADLPPKQREAYLREQGGSDAAVVAEVQGMLEHLDEGTMTSLKSPLGADAPATGPGDRIGPYKLLELIGEGGFGAVYMADQEQPVRRRVALKIIKLGMDTKQVSAARFSRITLALYMPSPGQHTHARSLPKRRRPSSDFVAWVSSMPVACPVNSLA